MSDPVYLDYNATTPVAPEVAEAMLPFLREQFGNPSSSHSRGQYARQAVFDARRQVAALIGATPEEIKFPIIADLSMTVAKAYGMIHPGAADTSPVPATFLIDPNGVLRAMVYSPMSNGRSIAEFLRLLQALQTSEAHKVATPEGWQPGEKVIVPPPATAAEAQARVSQGEYECVDWCFCKKSL